MAQIDTSIYGRFAPTVKLNTPFEIEEGYQQIQRGQDQNRLSQMQFQEADRVNTERNALADIAKQYGNTPEYGNELLKRGLVKPYQDHMKFQNDTAMSGVELKNKQLTGQKLQGDITQEQRERSAAKIGAHLNDPNLTVDKIYADLQSQVQSGELPLEQAQAMAQRIPQDPAQLKPFLNQILMGVMKPKDQVELGFKGRDFGFKERDFGLKSANEAFKADGTPNAAYQNFKIQEAAAKAENKPFTESENNAAGYLGRMRAAEGKIGTLKGGELTEGTAMAGAVPFVGDYLQRKAMNSTQQQYKQLSDDWIRAKLRKESGAVIAPEEMAAEYKTYFPQPGDMPEVIAQKAQARRQAEAQIAQSAGRASESLKQPKPPTGGKAANTNGLSADEVAELAALKKRFGK